MEKVKNKLKISNNTINIIVFIIFVLISLIVGYKHEPWADEAQSWLIARDNSIIEIFKMIRFEGTPALWPIILKLFIRLGVKYEYFFLISIFFNTIGVYLLLFKIKMPQILKVLLPFSYYIMYQFNIVSRSYCLLLPVLTLIILIYDNKKEKPLLYAFELILLMSISSHTYIMAGCLFLDFLVDCLICVYQKDLKLNKKKIIISTILLVLCFLITLIYVFPSEQCDFKGNSGLNSFVCIANALFSYALKNLWIDIILAIAFIGILVKKYDLKKNKLIFLIVCAPLIICSFIHTEVWHLGIIFLAILFMLVVTGMVEDKLIKYLLVIICLIQATWTFKTCVYDFRYSCSPNKEILEYLEENDYENKVVYGLYWNAIEINPYLENNIYLNYRSDKAYYNWNSNNNYMTIEEVYENLPDILITHKSNEYLMYDYEEFYTKKMFFGRVYAKKEIYINNDMIVFVRKSN